MSATRDTAPGDLIRQQIGSEANRRFLSRISAFRVDADMPEWLRVLLAEADRAEQANRPARG